MKTSIALVLLAATTTLSSGTTFTVTTTNDTGFRSLRVAIGGANASPGLDTITFNIPGTGPHTIQPLSPLPPITDPVVIDGYTQPGASPNSLSLGDNASLMIELDGTNAGPDAGGLSITAGGSTVRGLAINRFGSHGVLLSAAGGNVVSGNFIGTDLTGVLARGNGWGQDAGGIHAAQSSGSNVLGGAAVADRNLVSGNPQGIVISGSDGNQVLGNFIGTDVTGTKAIANTNLGGVLIYGGNGNRIGAPGAGNLISGNVKTMSMGWWDGGVGITVSSDDAVVIEGNLIGTDVTGKVALGNNLGANVSGRGGRIGGITAGAGNVISGNDYPGLFLSGTGHTVQGNFIGTDRDGMTAVGNGGTGVAVQASGCLIGGTVPEARNVISGNGSVGVAICCQGADNNVVQGNFIGTDRTGTKGLGQQSAGLQIGSSSTNLIGGVIPGARNVISGNGIAVDIRGNENKLQGNFIGTDVTGTVALGNNLGIYQAETAINNLIGGTAPGAGNLISGNSGGAISLGGHDVTGTRVQGNLIGTDAAGTQPLGNGYGVEVANITLLSN